MDDTTTEVIRQLQAMGLIVASVSDELCGVYLEVLIPSLENR